MPKELESTTRLGRTLVRMGKIDDDQLDKLLEEQRIRTNGKIPRLGDLAIEMGICTQDEIDEALDHQTSWRGPELSSRSDDALVELRAQAHAVNHMAEDLQKAVRKTRTGTMTVVKISPES